MNNYTVYRSERGGGKTSWIISQIAGLLTTADGPLDIAILVPHTNHAKIFLDNHVPVDIFVEGNLDRVRGRHYDYVFVDDACRFDRNSLDLCREYFIGAAASLTYTPFEGSSLPVPAPKIRIDHRFTNDYITARWFLSELQRMENDNKKRTELWNT